MRTDSRAILIVLAGACVLGVVLIVARSLGDRQLEPPAEPAAEVMEVERAAEVTTAPEPRREARVADGSPTTIREVESRSPPTAEPVSVREEAAIRSLLEAKEMAARFSGEGPTELPKSTSELAFLQTCVGHILAKANRGIEVGADLELSRTKVADDEFKFFHDGKMFIVRRGEFPVFDEARDRIASNFSVPRSPRYYEQYQDLCAQALSSLGADPQR